MGVIFGEAVAQGESFRDNCLGAKFWGVIVLGDFIGTNCPGRSCPGGIIQAQLSGV